MMVQQQQQLLQRLRLPTWASVTGVHMYWTCCTQQQVRQEQQLWHTRQHVQQQQPQRVLGHIVYALAIWLAVYICNCLIAMLTLTHTVLLLWPSPRPALVGCPAPDHLHPQDAAAAPQPAAGRCGTQPHHTVGRGPQPATAAGSQESGSRR
jgi:hypothetical protein